MHKQVQGLEWSGLIFYDSEGSITEPENLKLKIIDFHLLDIGSAGYTEFKLDTNLFDIYDAKPHLMGKAYGLMHSHHSMKAFFSGTDSGNLHESAQFFEYYLSLIVNHSGDFVAKVSVEGIHKASGVMSTKGSRGQYIDVPYAYEEKGVFVYDCNIQWEASETQRMITLLTAKTANRITTPFPKGKGYIEDWSWDRPANQLGLFNREKEVDFDAKLVELEESPFLNVDLKAATFNQKCVLFLEKLTFLEVGDPTFKDEVVRMSQVGGEIADEIFDDAEYYLQHLFESYLTLDDFVLENQKNKFVKELKHILRDYNFNKPVFKMFERQFANAFEIKL